VLLSEECHFVKDWLQATVMLHQMTSICKNGIALMKWRNVIAIFAAQGGSGGLGVRCLLS